MKLFATLLAVLAVFGASNAAPTNFERALANELAAELQQDYADSNKIFEAEIQGRIRDTIRGIWDDTKRRICQNPQEAEQVMMQAIENQLEMMQNGDDKSMDSVEMQFFRNFARNVRQWFRTNKDRVRNTIGEIGRNALNTLCNRFAPTTESTMKTGNELEEVLLQLARSQGDDGDSDTQEANSQGFFKKLKNIGKGILRRRFCDNLLDEQAQEEALAQYIDNKIEIMQDDEDDEDDDDDDGQMQFWRSIGRFWKRNKKYIKPVLKKHLCTNEEAEEEAVDSKTVERFFQSLLDSSQK